MSLPTTKIMVSSTSYRCKMELLFRSPGKLECVVLCHEKTPKTNLSTCSSSAWFHVFSMVLVLDYYHHHPHWIPRSQARHPVGHPSVSSTKASGFYIHQMNRKISVLLDCCECSSFGCINVSHAFKPHVAPRPNVCIPCGNSLTTLCPKQGCEQVMTQGYHHGKSCWIISCVTHNFKLDVSKSPGSYVDSSIKVKSLVVSIILVTPGHLHSQKEPVWRSAAL